MMFSQALNTNAETLCLDALLRAAPQLAGDTILCTGNCKTRGDIELLLRAAACRWSKDGRVCSRHAMKRYESIDIGSV